ncbi:hypothetical protein COOONC_18523 [Cooperia oncophora]
MSTVSAGGRRGPPKDFRGPPRGDLRMVKPRGRGYSQSDVGEPCIPRFSAVASEGVKMALPPEEYGENTTVLTGVTSEHSYSGDDRPVYEPPMGRVVSRRLVLELVIK